MLYMLSANQVLPSSSLKKAIVGGPGTLLPVSSRTITAVRTTRQTTARGTAGADVNFSSTPIPAEFRCCTCVTCCEPHSAAHCECCHPLVEVHRNIHQTDVAD